MKKPWFLFVSVILFQFVLVGCSLTTSPQKKLPEECLAQNLLITKEDIGALEESEPLWPMPDEPVNSAIHSFNPAPASTFVIQHKDKNIQAAYESYVEFAFREDKTSHSWSKPVDWSFESAMADEFEYRCGMIMDQYRCTYVARFNNYLIQLDLDIGDKGYSMDNFETGIIAIEREMAQCFAALESATPTP